jgi:hypothetical protein
MHKNFGEWYRLVSIEPTDDVLKKRWAGVEEWVSSICDDDDALLETVRIFRGLPEKTSREEFLAAFRGHDAAFAQRSNELEQRVLAGAALVQCVLAERDNDDEDDVDGVRAAVLAGTAVEASRLHASDDTLEELSGEVLAGLHEIAKYQRSRSGFSTVLFEAKEEEALTTTLAQLVNATDLGQLRTSVDAVFRTLLTALRHSESALEGAAHDLRCADEETNILWWLAGGSSRDLNQPWSALKEAIPLIAGWELADLTDVALGPQDAAALLERVVSETKTKSKEQPLHVYVNAVPEEWAKARAAKLAERAIDLTPLSLALSHRSKSNTSSWQQFFESNSRLKASTTLAPERVARLAYVEAVLFSTITKTES